MVEQAAHDYAKIIQSTDLSREIKPLCTGIDDMLARLDEFETLLANVRAETNDIIGNNVCSILSFSENFDELRKRIDNLETFVGIVNENLNKLERSVDVAEQELNVTDYSLKGLLIKPLKAKLSSTEAGASQAVKSNLLDGEFQPVPIYKTDNYFAATGSQSASHNS